MSDRVRTNPALRLTVKLDDDHDEFVFRNIDENTAFQIPNPGAVSLLSSATEPISRSDLVEFAVERFDLDEATADRAVEQLRSQNLLVDSDSVERRELPSSWSSATQYHETITDYPFHLEQEREQALSRVEERASERPDPPSVYRRYDAETTELPTPDGESLGTVRRAFYPSATDETATFDEARLSALLYWTFGEQGTIELDGVGEFLTKTSPSAGARHPTEGYVVLPSAVGRFDSGLYHYSVAQHGLTRLRSESAVAELSWVPTDWRESRLVVGLSAFLPRVMWKYHDPRAYRVPFHDMGHLLETFRLLCGSLGLAVSYEPLHNCETAHCPPDTTPLEEPFLFAGTVSESVTKTDGE